MKYLLDTNVISELVKEKPHPLVSQRLSALSSESFYLSVLTLGELRKSVEKLLPSSKKSKLESWLENDLLTWFDKRILSITIDVVDRWGRLQAEMNRSIPTIDSLIAATALHYDATVITRNTKDFEYPGLVVINPFIG